MVKGDEIVLEVLSFENRGYSAVNHPLSPDKLELYPSILLASLFRTVVRQRTGCAVTLRRKSFRINSICNEVVVNCVGTPLRKLQIVGVRSGIVCMTTDLYTLRRILFQKAQDLFQFGQ